VAAALRGGRCLAHKPYAEEVLPQAPSRWYLTGFLVPYEAKCEVRSDDTGDEQTEEVGRAGYDDDAPPEQASARKAHFPSSMGLSVLVPGTAEKLHAAVRWGDYAPVGTKVDAADAGGATVAPEGTETGPTKAVPPEAARRPSKWKRTPREAMVELPLEPNGTHPPMELKDAPGVQLVVSVRTVGAGSGLPAGARSVSVFVVNRRPPAPDVAADEAFIFQPELRLKCTAGFVERPDVRGRDSSDPDEQMADLQYRDAVEYAVGHNVSALAEVDDGHCREVRTCWMPVAEVEKVVPAEIEHVELRMEVLAAAATPAGLRSMLAPMTAAYTAWLDTQTTRFPGEPMREETARGLVGKARLACDRIARGIDVLDDADAFEAFRLMNRVMARAIRQRECHGREGMTPDKVRTPTWYPFQLAFVLLNLAAMVQPADADRRTVDLLWFPTGGGKTESYLGLAAFTMALRRLRDPSIQSAGMTVLMRYTLRLLTLDQLGRAATMICALELERQSSVDRLGRWPFEIGLWVGQAATPNRMGRKGDKDEYSARARTIAFQNEDRRKPSPIPLENCPWCGEKFDRNSFQLLPDPNEPLELRVFCRSRACEFRARKQERGLPILAVDDQIYRRLPAFLIATVDKFASLPWVGETGGLFGKGERFDGEGFHGPCRPNVGRPLAGPLPPPDLVIQDELHLISGPLGTMVGLYETAIDELCRRKTTDGVVRPKIVASTATVRRATKQIQGLFARSSVGVFPPPGPDRRNSFFALTVPPSVKNARVYVGIAAQGRNLKVVLLRTYLALIGAAQKQWRLAGGDRTKPNPADPYMTLLGYFNSLRELGGSRRIVEDEVRSRLVAFADRVRGGEKEGLFESRKSLRDVCELTSRVSTAEVADARRRLGLSFDDKESLDVALATNMISVGLDVIRLGLMVVTGQPKSAAEYIQATSRVGRDPDRPGLVVTMLNVHRPRDRSHFERFTAWHESFYRAVEATSVTPFSPRALDRGLAGVTVALARLGNPQMTPALGAGEAAGSRTELDFVADAVSRRAEGHDSDLGADAAEELRQRTRARTTDLLDSWAKVATDKGELQYAREVGRAPPLLFDPLDKELSAQSRDARKFKAHRSLRDVESTVKLFVQRPAEAGDPEGKS